MRHTIVLRGLALAYTLVAVPLKEQVVRCALDLGFDLVRVASSEPFVEDGMAAKGRVRRRFMDGMPWFTQERTQRAAWPARLSDRTTGDEG